MTELKAPLGGQMPTGLDPGWAESAARLREGESCPLHLSPLGTPEREKEEGLKSLVVGAIDPADLGKA